MFEFNNSEHVGKIGVRVALRGSFEMVGSALFVKRRQVQMEQRWF